MVRPDRLLGAKQGRRHWYGRYGHGRTKKKKTSQKVGPRGRGTSKTGEKKFRHMILYRESPRVQDLHSKFHKKSGGQPQTPRWPFGRTAPRKLPLALLRHALLAGKSYPTPPHPPPQPGHTTLHCSVMPLQNSAACLSDRKETFSEGEHAYVFLFFLICFTSQNPNGNFFPITR